MTALPASDRKHAEAYRAVASLASAIVRTLPPEDRREFAAFVERLFDDQRRVTVLKSSACGKTEMLLSDVADLLNSEATE
jgi:hypothetical protein